MVKGEQLENNVASTVYNYIQFPLDFVVSHFPSNNLVHIFLQAQ